MNKTPAPDACFNRKEFIAHHYEHAPIRLRPASKPKSKALVTRFTEDQPITAAETQVSTTPAKP